jgi:hypothetical protein
MVTGHENKGHFRQPVDHFRTYLDNLAGLGAPWQIFIGFALDFTGMAPNTGSGILEQIIFTHSTPPVSYISWLKLKGFHRYKGIVIGWTSADFIIDIFLDQRIGKPFIKRPLCPASLMTESMQSDGLFPVGFSPVSRASLTDPDKQRLNPLVVVIIQHGHPSLLSDTNCRLSLPHGDSFRSSSHGRPLL